MVNIKRNINSYLHEHVHLYRMNKWLNMRSSLFLERDCKNGILVLKEFPTWHHQWKSACLPREVLSMQLIFSSPVLSTHCGGFLAKYLVVLRRRSISQYFFVCQFCQHARDTHDIHHAYILASFSAFLHFLMFACKVACLGCFHFQKQVWACHLSNRLSPISRKSTFFLQFPIEFISHGRRLFQFLPSKKRRRSPIEFVPHWV